MEGKTFDNILEEKAHAGTPWKFAERRFCLKDARKGGKGRKGVDDVEMQAERSDVDTLTGPYSTTASSIIKGESTVLLTDEKIRAGKLTYKTQVQPWRLTGPKAQADDLLMAR